MPKPLLLEIQEKPVTSIVITTCVVMWMLITHRRWGYEALGVSYQKIFVENEYWRLIVSQISHIDLIHLVMNMTSLWSLRFIETLPRFGKLYYIKVTIILLICSKVVTLGMYYVLVNFLKRDYFKRVISIGYSSVVFGWMANLSIVRPRNGRFSFLGLPSIPMSLAPFASLIMTSIMIPRSSFWGHLGGIIAGYLIGFKCFDWLNLFWSLSLSFWSALAILIHLIRQRKLNLPFLTFDNSELNTNTVLDHIDHQDNDDDDDAQILINRLIP